MLEKPAELYAKPALNTIRIHVYHKEEVNRLKGR